MMDCMNADVRDLLPDYAAGRLTAADREHVARHLAGCAACVAELSLVHSVARALAVAPPVDVSRIVGALPAPPRRAAPGVVSIESRRRVAPVRAWTSPRRVAAIAAAVVGAVSLALLGSDRASRVTDAPPAVADAVVKGLPATPIDRRSSGREVAAASGELSLAAGISELTDESLRALLGDIDALDDSASIEPADALPAISGLDEESGV